MRNMSGIISGAIRREFVDPWEKKLPFRLKTPMTVMTVWMHIRTYSRVLFPVNRNAIK